MSVFTRSVRAQVTQALDPSSVLDENPLTIIGLGPEILDLGLSDDELYEYCHRSARSLVVLFHPDRAGYSEVVEKKQRRFASAFEQLEQRINFNAALAEFRQRRAEGRSEINRISRELKDTRAVRKMAEERIRQELAQTRELNQSLIQTQDSTIIHVEALSRKMRVGSRFQRSVLASESFRALTLYFRVVESRGIRSREGQDQLIKRAEYLDREIRRMGRTRKALYSTVSSPELIALQHDLTSVLDELRLSNISARRPEHLLKDFVAGRVSSVQWDFNSACREAGLGLRSLWGARISDRRELLSDYYGGKAQFRRVARAVLELMADKFQYVDECTVGFIELDVRNGFFRQGSRDFRIIGSIDGSEVNLKPFLLRGPSSSGGRMIDEISPILRAEDWMVTQSVSLLSRSNQAYAGAKRKTVLASELRDRPSQSMVNHVVMEIRM